MDKYDPNEWTPSFVRENKNFCLTFLQDTNVRVIDCLKQGKHDAAVVGIDRMLNGAIVLHNSGAANMKPFLATNSFNQGIIFVCGMKDRPEQKRRQAAVTAFSDARDFSASELGNIAGDVIRMLQSGRALNRIADEVCPSFPQDLVDLMQGANRRLEQQKD